MPYRKDGLMPRVWLYMNKHPNATLTECIEEFRDEEYKNTRRCFHDWVRFVKPIHFLYFLLKEKFIPIEKISIIEKKKLQEIEKKLGLMRNYPPTKGTYFGHSPRLD